MTVAAIDWSQLGQLVWVSAVAGVAVAVAFAVLIVGATRATEFRRADRDGPATGYAVLAVVAALAIAGGVAFGISVIVAK